MENEERKGKRGTGRAYIVQKKKKQDQVMFLFVYIKKKTTVHFFPSLHNPKPLTLSNMEHMDIYMEMLADEGIIPKSENTVQVVAHKYRRDTDVYPEHWLPPSQHDFYKNYTMEKVKYVPYKRLSHFREHLSRLQYMQNISIPSEIWMCICQCLGNRPADKDDHLYAYVKDHLKKEGFSKYNEHIHYLISKFTKNYILISYADQLAMIDLFLHIEREFKKAKARHQFEGTRKNIFSYYIMIQFILFLFHYHSHYKLPTLKDDTKRKEYYKMLLEYIATYEKCDLLLYMFENRRRQCQYCMEKTDVCFDDTLKELFT